MQTIVLIVHVLVAVLIVGLVLLQRGKGAEAGAAFGAGSSSTVFGSAGSANFLSRTTAILATVFFLSSLTLAYFIGQDNQGSSLMTEQVIPVVPQTPAPVPQLPDLPSSGDQTPTN